MLLAAAVLSAAIDSLSAKQIHSRRLLQSDLPDDQPRSPTKACLTPSTVCL